MNRDACTRYKQARQALNETCQGILQDYAKNAQPRAKLRQPQPARIALSEAYLEVRFPRTSPGFHYASVIR